ncbi:hypothetical protein RD1_2124 [Roseobacter denitrificans OCh 114]|uniref:Flp pilus assembly protein, pilin Flp n=3 Tax=Roseobacter denitrificans TaxID=2434 RepID=Q167X3_ROSDO|nr:hypothetical protein RD1_2124 [Roseobacter denitrificans OCh 114]
MMLAKLNKFMSRENGAVSADWVVLTAAVAGFCIAFIVELRSDATSLSFLTQRYLEAQDPQAAAGGMIQD